MQLQNNLPRVSVIIPTYNRSALLRLTAESVLAQTYPNVELIVVDDGSTDDTEAVMADYADRIIYIKQEHHADYTRNIGFDRSSGEYINFLDHDDLMMPNKIERQAHILNTRPEIDLVHCGYYHIDVAGKRLEKISFLPTGTLKELVCNDFIWSGAPLIRRRCLDQVGLFDEQSWSSDWDMWVRIAQAGYRFACVQEPLGAYRILAGSEMSNVVNLEQGVIYVLDKVFSDPHLSAEVAAVKEQAYGYYRVWLSGKYYAAGLWDDACRNLVEALKLNPRLRENPVDLLPQFRSAALSLRVGDPVRLISNVFDHLPPEVDELRQYRLFLLSQVYIELALRNYGCGSFAEAKNQLAEAIVLYPAILDQPDYFADMLNRAAMRWPVSDPVNHVETVFQNLPSSAEPLAIVRPRVLDEVNIGSAFQDYFAGRHQNAVARVLKALKRHPSRIVNKGIASIFFKSLPGLLSGPKSGYYAKA